MAETSERQCALSATARRRGEVTLTQAERVIYDVIYDHLPDSFAEEQPDGWYVDTARHLARAVAARQSNLATSPAPLSPPAATSETRGGGE